MRIEGAVVLVTGASSGIGAATSRLAAARGARVVLAARRRDRIESLAAELPDAVAVPTDVTDAAQVPAMVETAVERYGRIDVLVNNAGQGLHVPVEQIDLDELRAVFELNVVAALATLQAVVPVMRRQGGGSIVNVSSGTTLFTPRGTGGYAATKAALNMLSAVARAELADDGIVVSTVYPFITATEFHQVLRAGGGPARGGRPGMEPAECGLRGREDPRTRRVGRRAVRPRTGAAPSPLTRRREKRHRPAGRRAGCARLRG